MSTGTLKLTYFSSKKRKKRFRAVLTWALLLAGLAWFMFPLLWMVSSSLKSFQDLNTFPTRFLPSTLVWSNYREAWERVPFDLFFRNTLILAAINVIGTVLSSSVVAYGFSRLEFRGRDFLFAVMLSTMMLPWWVTLIPTYLIFRRLEWIDSWLPLTVPSFLGSASRIFLLRQFFLTLPRELDEAAEIDGCSKLGIFWRILVPLCKPVLATIAIFTFMGTWNSYLQPLIYLHRPELFTVSIGLQFLDQAANREFSAEPVEALIMAAGVFTSVPLLLVFFLGQNYFVKGIALTGRTGM
jgi:multiple sugar transport system permease protein